MYRREYRHQRSFEDFFLPFGSKLLRDTCWIKLAEIIPEMYWRIAICPHDLQSSPPCLADSPRVLTMTDAIALRVC